MCLVAQLCLTLCDPMDCSPPGSSVHENFPDKNTGVGCLQSVGSISRDLSNSGIKPMSPTWQVDSFPLKVKVAQSCPTLCNPRDYTVHGILQARILEWAALPFSMGSSQSRDRTQVSHIAGGFFTNRAIREAVFH